MLSAEQLQLIGRRYTISTMWSLDGQSCQLCQLFPPCAASAATQLTFVYSGTIYSYPTTTTGETHRHAHRAWQQVAEEQVRTDIEALQATINELSTEYSAYRGLLQWAKETLSMVTVDDPIPHFQRITDAAGAVRHVQREVASKR